MAIEQFEGGIIFTGEDTHVYRILVLRTALECELAGIRVRHGRSVFASVKQEFGLTGSRQSVYEQFCHMHKLETRAERQAKKG